MPPAAVLEALLRYDAQNDLHLIIWSLRLPRMCVALLTGLALGIAGALMQALTRNPLAEPGLLGINAGAALAVMTGISLFGFVSIWEYVWFGFAGAGLAGVAVFVLGQAHETGTRSGAAGSGRCRPFGDAWLCLFPHHHQFAARSAGRLPQLGRWLL
ncbi:FecCD family ABC transporter permease [Pannonibacter phragmitetus]|uniref:FecCD family ABC transporter permease n=1 Tax=Pannonibacter phragmitetus TaxID=121719 RepID=UPI003D2EC235